MWPVSPDIKEREGKKGENEEHYGGSLCKYYGEFFDKACVCESTRLDDVFCILIQKYKLQRKLPRWNVEEILWRKYLEEGCTTTRESPIWSAPNMWWLLTLSNITKLYDKTIDNAGSVWNICLMNCSIPTTKQCGVESSIIIKKVLKKTCCFETSKRRCGGFSIAHTADSGMGLFVKGWLKIIQILIQIYRYIYR